MSWKAGCCIKEVAYKYEIASKLIRWDTHNMQAKRKAVVYMYHTTWTPWAVNKHVSRPSTTTVWLCIIIILLLFKYRWWDWLMNLYCRRKISKCASWPERLLNLSKSHEVSTTCRSSSIELAHLAVNRTRVCDNEWWYSNISCLF